MGATDGFSKASWEVYTDFQEALEQLLALQQEGLGKSEILKHFARSKKNLLLNMKWTNQN